MTDLDMRELRDLAVDLEQAAKDHPDEVRRVFQRGAFEIKKQLQTEAQGVRHAPKLPSDISYETKISRDGIDAEIGPTTGDVGSLALLYFGNSKTGPVLKDPAYALEREAAVIEKQVAKIVGDLL